MPGESTATRAASHALHHGAVIADRSDRLRMWFAGASAADTLNGLVTNDLASLAAGQGAYAAALSPKGKVIADVRLFRMADGLLVDADPAAAPGWSTMVRKYVNPRLTKYEDRSAALGQIGVYGPDALRCVREALGGEAPVPASAAAYAHVSVDWQGGRVIVIGSPDLGVPGFDLVAPTELLAPLQERLEAAGAVPSTAEALDTARIEAGRPRYGTDMDENTLAQEVDMDRLGAISYSKGCYTGQETVARVHFRGHVNRLLRGLRVAGDALPDPGAELLGADGKAVGSVKSVARSDRLGGIALALVRREVEPGATVTAGDTTAIVVELPFEDPVTG